MKHVLVTGGLGFIGSHLIQELGRCDDCLIDLVDDLSNNWINPDELADDHVGQIATCKVEDFSFSREYDQIYHLASPVGPAGVLNYAGVMGGIIINDALKVAEYAAARKTKVLYMSTSEVYGKDPRSGGQKEDIDKRVPPKVTVRLEYGVAKLLMEICLTNYATQHPMAYNIIRPFNIIGIGQSAKAGFVVPRFVQQALHNEDMTVFGDGQQVRTFTHVLDIVHALITVMESGINGEIFNVGNPQNKMSILDVAHQVKVMTYSKSNIVCVDPKSIYGEYYEEAWNKIPDITKICEQTSWKPVYSFERTIQEIIDYYDKDLSCNTLL